MVALGGILANKWAVIGIGALLLFLFGGGDFISNNPTIVVFGILALIIMGDKK